MIVVRLDGLDHAIPKVEVAVVVFVAAGTDAAAGSPLMNCHSKKPPAEDANVKAPHRPFVVRWYLEFGQKWRP